MFVGENSIGVPVDIEEAEKSENYWCACCGGELIIKDGPVKIKHFSHKSRKDCDEWHSDMSAWHRNWQKRFPVDSREVVIENNGSKHRADVCIGDYVLEFQNSPMSRDEFDIRTEFYTSAGYKLVWIFNFIDKAIYPLGYKNGSKMYAWNWATKMFSNFDITRKDVFLYFEMPDYSSIGSEGGDNGIVFNHVIWMPNIDGDYSPKRFIVNNKGPFRKNNFVNYISAGLLR